MSECTSSWWAGLACDHLYADCLNRIRFEASLRQAGWWNTGTEGRALHPTIDPHDTDVCGMCLHRHNRTCQRVKADA